MHFRKAVCGHLLSIANNSSIVALLLGAALPGVGGFLVDYLFRLVMERIHERNLVMSCGRQFGLVISRGIVRWRHGDNVSISGKTEAAVG